MAMVLSCIKISHEREDALREGTTCCPIIFLYTAVCNQMSGPTLALENIPHTSTLPSPNLVGKQSFRFMSHLHTLLAIRANQIKLTFIFFLFQAFHHMQGGSAISVKGLQSKVREKVGIEERIKRTEIKIKLSEDVD